MDRQVRRRSIHSIHTIHTTRTSKACTGLVRIGSTNLAALTVFCSVFGACRDVLLALVSALLLLFSLLVGSCLLRGFRASISGSVCSTCGACSESLAAPPLPLPPPPPTPTSASAGVPPPPALACWLPRILAAALTLTEHFSRLRSSPSQSAFELLGLHETVFICYRFGGCTVGLKWSYGSTRSTRERERERSTCSMRLR